MLKLPKDIQVTLDRELCHRSFAKFAQKAWHVLEPTAELKWGWALDAICEHLQAVHDGLIRRLLINVPPGMMKSLLTSVMFPAWEWGAGGAPSMRFLSTSHKEALAMRDNIKCRRLITSPWFQERWPVEIANDQNSKGKFENTATGFREAMSFTSLTGSRGDRVILDDPLSADDVYSPAALEAAKRSFTEALPTRVNNEDSAIIVIMQRLSEEDTSGIILSRDLGYEHLMLPMEFEPARRCHTSIGFVDPRTEEGELLFPERFPRRQVDELKKTMGAFAVAGQFQQRPSPLGGGIIKGAWFVRYDRLPRIRYRFVTVDTAMKEKECNDFQVAQCWGVGRDDGRLYLIDEMRGKFQAYELRQRIPDFWKKQKADQTSPLRTMYIEDKASGTQLIQDITAKPRPGESRIPVIPVQRDRSKLQRVMDVQSYIENGSVCLPADASFVHDFIAECEAFTPDDSHPHDDQIDCMVDAITFGLTKTNVSYSEVV